jgi:hypothetical protein
MGCLQAIRVLALAGVLAIASAPAAQAVAGGEDQPTAQQVQAGLDRAAALHHQVAQQAATVEQARAAVQASAADAALALETYSQATVVRDDAARRADQLDAALDQAQQGVDAARDGLARWARDAYVDGGALGTSSPGLYTLLAGGSTDDVATARIWLERSGEGRVQVIDRLRTAIARQQQAADVARHACDVAEAAAAQAAAASSARDAVLTTLRDRLADLEVLLAGTREAAGLAQAQAGRLEQARAGSARAGALAANRVTGQVGDCLGRDTSAFPNGRIPLTALCPLWGVTGLLRADAAYAFNRMSRAFEIRFGEPICVSDSYRSYDDQVRVRAERGTWAALPGHSNHGWGTAVDLCGGVESFDSPEHAWLAINAPLYDWFHPAWAERGGSLPEPWHWEYAGEG